MPVSLRVATVADAKTIHRLQVEAFLPLLEKYQDHQTNPANDTLQRIIDRLQQPQTTYYLIVEDEHCVGAARVVCGTEDSEARISPICIVPQHQGKGFGQQAMDLLEQTTEVKHWTLNTILQELGA